MEIQFEFDLHNDDSSSVIEEMSQLEDLAHTAVKKEQIMLAFHPFVLAARQIMTTGMGTIQEAVGNFFKLPIYILFFLKYLIYT